MQIKTRVYAHEAYNLNKYRAFIEPSILHGSLEEVLDFSSEVLLDHGCEKSAVIIHTLYEKVFTLLQLRIFEEDLDFHDELQLTEADIGNIVQKVICTDYEPGIVGAIDASYRLCCYALIIQRKANEWVVVGE